MASPFVHATAQAPVRVLVADDSFLIREGLVQLLAISPAVRVVGAHADMPSLLAAVDAEPPDVVVTDIRMPPSQTDEGLKIAERLRHSHPAVGVVLLSQFDHAHYAARLLSDGAAGRGYLLKDRIHDLEHMVSVIVGTAHGECRIDAELIDSLLSRKRARQVASDLHPAELGVGWPRSRQVKDQRRFDGHSAHVLRKPQVPDQQPAQRGGLPSGRA